MITSCSVYTDHSERNATDLLPFTAIVCVSIGLQPQDIIMKIKLDNTTFFKIMLCLPILWPVTCKSVNASALKKNSQFSPSKNNHFCGGRGKKWCSHTSNNFAAGLESISVFPPIANKKRLWKANLKSEQLSSANLTEREIIDNNWHEHKINSRQHNYEIIKTHM